MNTIGKQVRRYRKALGLTQEELAEGICNRSYISQLEKGYSLPTPEIVRLIAERLQTTVSDLLADDEDVAGMEKIQVQSAIRHIISNIEENNWEKAHKWVCALSEAELDTEEKSVYEWAKGCLAQSDQCFDQAATYFLESISLARQVDDHLLLIRALTSLGELYSMTEQAQKAVGFLYEAMQAALQYHVIGMPRISLHYAMGYMHTKLGEYHSGIEQFQQAERLNQAYGSLYKSGDTYMGLAVCYRLIQEYEKAEQLNMRALEVLRLYADSKRESRIAGVHNNLGILYANMKKYDAAIAHIEKAIHIHEQMGNQHWVNNTTIELANIYNQLGRYEEARRLCETVIHNHTTEHVLHEAMLTLSESLCQLGKGEQALTAIEKALSYFCETPNCKYYIKACSILTKISVKNSGEIQKASAALYDKYLVLI